MCQKYQKILLPIVFILMIALGLKASLSAQASPANNNGEWQKLNPATSPSPRYGHSMTNINGDVYLIGGIASGNVTKDDLWKYNSLAKRWSEILPTLPKPKARAHHSAVAKDSKSMFMGELKMTICRRWMIYGYMTHLRTPGHNRLHQGHHLNWPTTVPMSLGIR